MGFLIKTNLLLYIIIISIVFRFIISFLPSFELDEISYRYFSAKLTQYGPGNFFSSSGSTLNAVGFFYPLWITGLVKERFFPEIDFYSKDYDFLLKIPASLTDIFSGILIYYIIKRKTSGQWGILGFLMYVFNPAIFFNSSVWGQYDSISTFFLLLSAYTAISNKTLLMSIFFAIALTLKPQAIFFAPLALMIIYTNTKPKIWFLAFWAFLLTILIVYIPFFPKNPLYGIYLVNSNLATTYTCTTCFAFNFWGIFGNWQNDINTLLYIPFLYWGVLLYLLTLLFIILRRDILKISREPFFYLLTAICITGSFIFLTRMHERYIFSAFPFLLISSILLRSKILAYLYLAFSLLSFINLYLPYAYYNKHLNLNPELTSFLLNNFQLFSLIFTLLYLVLLFFYFKLDLTKK